MTEQQERDLQHSVMPNVTVYSDGSYKPVLKTGGYGTIMTCNNHCLFSYGGCEDTSNNVMELVGALQAIRRLTCPCNVTIYTDSMYVVNGVNKYLRIWASNNWIKSDGRVIANCELWQEMWDWCQYHLISCVWVKGHSNNFNNSICDNFASIAAYHVRGLPVPEQIVNRI